MFVISLSVILLRTWKGEILHDYNLKEFQNFVECFKVLRVRKDYIIYIYLSGNVTTIVKAALFSKLLYELLFFLANNQLLLKTYLPQNKSSTS